MKLKIRAGFIMLALTFGLLFGQAMAQSCGDIKDDIVFAGLDWNSAQFHNYIARYILEEGFGCSTADIPGTTVPMVQGLIRGDIDVNMEIWFNNAPDFYHEAREDGDIVDLGLNMNGVEAFWVPRYIIEGDADRGIAPMAPGLESVSDLPQYAELFRDPEEPGKGRFYNCIIGWQCELVNNVKYYAYGLDDTFTNFKPGSGAALASEIEAAYKQGEPILTYYWGPTWVLGSFDMVQLKEPAYDEAVWKVMKGATDRGAFDSVSEAVAYPTSVVNVAVSKDFAEDASPAMIDFLTAYGLDQLVVSRYLALMKNEGLEAEDAAINFLEENPDIWTAWVPAEVATRVQDSF